MTVIDKISEYFEFAKHRTNLKTEIIAGVSTFMALSYIFVVNPSILVEAGMNKSSVLFATIVASALATFFMGVWAKKPLVLAPGMEMNAYVAFMVILGLGFTWQEALGAVFWSGVIFLALTLTGIRENIINSIPDRMKAGLALCVGVFLMLIALRLAGVLIYEGVTFNSLGILLSPMAYVMYFGLAAVLTLRKLRMPGAVLISIILASALAHYLGLGAAGEQVEISDDMLSGIMKLDLGVILNPRALSIILVLFLVDFYGSVAKIVGLTRNINAVKKDGTLTRMKEALVVDGTANMAGAVLGTTSIITYVESAVGIAEGGRTGFTAVVCAVLMLLFIVLTPLVNLVPLIATTGALFWVGIHLFPSQSELKEYSKLDIAAVAIMIIGVILTFSIDRALLFGFLIYIAGLVFGNRYKEISKFMVISTILLLIGFLISG